MKKFTFEYEVILMGSISVEAETEKQAQREARSMVEDGYWIDNGSLTSVIVD